MPCWSEMKVKFHGQRIGKGSGHGRSGLRAVRFAAQRAVESLQPASDKRVGVVWHTQGSGKSLSMVYFTGILRHWPGLNPTILVQVDRNELDKQLYRSLSAIQLEDLTSLCYGTLAGDESLKEDFLHEEHRLAKAYSLIYHLPTGQQHGDEVAFYQLVRNRCASSTPKANATWKI